jgi:hypothetical protein
VFAPLLLVSACDPGAFDRVQRRGEDAEAQQASDASDASGSTETPPSLAEATTAEGAQVSADLDARTPSDALPPTPPEDMDATQDNDDAAVAADGDASASSPDATAVDDAGAACFRAGQSLIGYLKMDGVPSDAVPVASGGAEVAGVGAKFDTGRVGGALHAGEVSFSQARLDEPQALTISAWVQLDTAPLDLNAAWLWKGDNAGFDLTTGYWLVFASSRFRAENARYLTGVAAQGHLGLGLTNGTDEQFLLTDRAFPLLRYVHVVATFDGARARLYLDGRIERDDEQHVIVRRTTTPVRLASPLGGALSPLLGQLDEVAFFDRALSPSEVSELYSRSGVVCIE